MQAHAEDRFGFETWHHYIQTLIDSKLKFLRFSRVIKLTLGDDGLRSHTTSAQFGRPKPGSMYKGIPDRSSVEI